MMIRTRLYRFANRIFLSKSGLWLPDMDIDVVPRVNNVLGVLSGPEECRLYAHNLVGDAGDLHYTERLDDQFQSSGAPTNAFGVAELATATPTQGKTDNRSDYTIQSGSEKAISSGYPKRDDNDPNNTGAGADIITHLFSWTPADGDWTGLVGGIITNASPGASEPILTGWDFAASFAKDSDTALDIFVNHRLNGT